MKIDLIPFVAETIGYNNLVYEKVDKIYFKDKYTYYKLAKYSEFYNSSILCDNDFIKEEYCKKSLGIILHLITTNDEELKIEFYDMINVGWNYTTVYVKSRIKFDIKDFTSVFIKKNGGFENLSTDKLNHNLLIGYFLAVNNGKEIVQSEMLENFNGMLLDRMNFDKNTLKRISIPNDTEALEKIRVLRNKLLNTKNKISIDDMYGKYRENDYLNLINYMFDYEFMSVSICDMKLDQKEIDEIIWSMIYVNPDEEINKFISLIYIRSMLKKFKELKKHYLENNKETMYFEINSIEKENQKLKSEIELLKKNVNESHKVIKNQENLIKKLEKKVNDSRLYDQELYSLREFIFNLDNELEDHKTKETTIEITNKILVLGGHENWQNRMKKVLPNTIFIKSEELNYDTSLIQNVELVYIYINYLNHGIYYKTIGAAKRYNKKIYYLNASNEKIILEEMYRAIRKKEENK
jgi:hypothetical protein